MRLLVTIGELCQSCQGIKSLTGLANKIGLCIYPHKIFSTQCRPTRRGIRHNQSTDYYSS